MRLNEEHVSAEEIDGDLLVINFATGRYFVMQDTAIEIWNALLAGADAQTYIAAQRDRPGFAGAGEEQVHAFATQLMEEALLLPGRSRNVKLGTAATPWIPPQLELFEDMEALLKLDPVVDIAQEGWPQAAQ